VVEAQGIEVEVIPEMADALERARSLAGDEDRIIVTGSLYAVGAARAALGASQ
jgi:folylpolyglutamate synthase/dihydropteroate synthase